MKNKLSSIGQSAGFKAGVLAVLTLVMLIPAAMTGNLIRERASRAMDVKYEIASASGGELKFGGPVLKIPGKRINKRITVASDGKRVTDYYEEDFTIWYTARNLKVRADLKTEEKTRGIFSAPIFNGSIYFEADFNLNDNETLFYEKAEMVIPFFNQKGIKQVVEAEWNGTEVQVMSGGRDFPLYTSGVYAKTPLLREQASTGEDFKFSLTLLVRGAGRISILPLSESSDIVLQADWPAPAFYGMALPDNHEIDDSGFIASWTCSGISSGIPAMWQGSSPPNEKRLADSFIETVLIDVHSHYAQNERAVKYAVLFILIPFITLFMFEQFFRKPIHIVQYILTGTANIIFYLLLLSLSEHIHFNYSYLISSAAVTVMVCLYTFSMLKGDVKSWYMAPVMISAYLFLFVTLQSEDWALLIGSVGVFCITGFLMFVTRKIDFYRTQ